MFSYQQPQPFLLACIFSYFVLVHAHLQGINDRRICNNLVVGHPLDDIPNPNEVSVNLTRNGESETCYESNTVYNVSIRSPGRSIYGLLILQDPDRSYGTFPLGGNLGLRRGLVGNVCGSSVSHDCRAKSRSEHKVKCNLGSSLDIPYRSPNNKDNDLEFRYSIVFTYESFLEDRRAIFPPCNVTTPPPPPPPSPTPEPCDAENFTVPLGTEPVTNLCRMNKRYSSMEYREIVENGTKYECKVAGDAVRKKNCSTGCAPKGVKLCCGVLHTEEKNRMFNCTSMEEDTPEEFRVIEKTFTVIQERKCVCYKCSDVCPAALEPSEDSSEDQNSVEDEDNGTDEDQNSVNAV